MKTQKKSNPLIKRLETEILIIGAGGAGLRAAIEAYNNAANVLIISKEYLGGAHTSMAMGGINVAIKAPATPKQHYDDTIHGGWNINNYKMAKVFSKEMPERIYDLERYGVKFDRLPDGSFYTWAGGKQSAPLNLCAGDYTGREMMNGLVHEVKRLKIPYLEDYFVTKLIKKGKSVIGAFLMNLKTGEFSVIAAKAVIVATGGAGMLYLINTNAPSNTGEGYAWALDAGAELVDMEMIQFHPTGMAYPPEKKGALITEKVRGHGGILKNKNGERFMKRYQPERMELAGRDEVARAIYQEVAEGRGLPSGGVWLDTTHWEKGSHEKIIPDVFEEHRNVGIDIQREMMQVAPSMHHVMGGINITEWGESTVDGLYAAGEVTRTVHGANRLGGNSIAEGQVFGKRVGLKTAKDAKKRKLQIIPQPLIEEEAEYLEKLQNRKTGENVDMVILELRTLMWDYVGLIRDEKKLQHAKAHIKKIQKKADHVIAKNREDLQKCLELQQMVITAEAIIDSALVRRESRGAHFRTDYPKMKSSWEKNIVVYKKNGELKAKTVPIVR